MRFALLFSVLALGCGRATLKCPTKGGNEWREYTTTHFRMRTDLSNDAAREQITRLEQHYVALGRLAFPTVQDRRGRMTVIAFRDPDDYRALGGGFGKSIDGWFRPVSADPEWGPTLVYAVRLTARAQMEVANHITAGLVAERAIGAPPWVYFGLRELYSTIALEKGHATFGRHPWKIRFNNPEATAAPDAARAAVARSTSLRTLGFDEFCSNRSKAPNGLYQTQYATALQNGAWGLAHVLRFGPEKSAFETYLDEFANGVKDSSAAWARTLGAQDAGLAARLDALLNDPTKSELTVAYDAQPVTVDERALGSADVHITWALTRNHRDPHLLPAAIGDAKEALAESPTSGEARFALAILATDPFERERYLREALETAKNDPRYLHALAREYLNRQLAKPVAARTWGMVEPLVARLEKVAVSSLQLELLAEYFVQTGRLDEASGWARRAVDTDAGCLPCRLTASRIHERRGDWSQAIREQHAAAGLSTYTYFECADLTRDLQALMARAPKPLP